jgi:PAS domain-containing protein
MSDSASRPHFTPDPADAPHPSEEGVWELDLWDGAARFNDWFYQRLSWPTEAKRNTLHDLRPYLLAGDWDRLLSDIRGHLEQGRPLSTEILMQLPSGRVEWWRVFGTAEFNTGGHPVYLVGSMRAVTNDERADPFGGEI